MDEFANNPRPTDDYDVDAWLTYYDANPSLNRSVGAEGAEGGDGGSEGPAGGGSGDGGEGSGDAGGGADGGKKDDAGTGEGAGDGKGDGAGEKSDKGAGEEGGKGDPVVYSAESFNLPDGMEADEGLMASFLEIANNRDLSEQDRNQALVTMYAQKTQEMADAQTQRWDEVRKGWQDELKADKEFGGKNLDSTKAHALKAMSEYGSKELQEFGEQFGWADNPHYMKFLAKVGKTLSEDRSTNNRGGDNQASISDRWYGKPDSDDS